MSNVRSTDIYICRNHRCRRYRVPIVTNAVRCMECNTRLKAYYAGPDDKDNPLIDFGDVKVQAAGSTRVLPPPKVDNTFVGESNCDVKGCPVAPHARVRVPWPLYQKWVYLCREFDTEWLAYLKGEQTDDGVWNIFEEGMYFPKQTAQAAHVEAADNSVEQEGTIAAVHSHVDMNAFFSKEDEDHFNHPVEFVVNRKGEMKAVVRVKLDCGRYQRADARIYLTGIDANLALVDELKTKLIEVKTGEQVVGYAPH